MSTKVEAALSSLAARAELLTAANQLIWKEFVLYWISPLLLPPHWSGVHCLQLWGFRNSSYTDSKCWAVNPRAVDTGEKGLVFTPISFSHLAFATAALKSPSCCKRRNCLSVSENSVLNCYWGLRVQQWWQDSVIWWEKKYFLAKGNKFKQKGTQPCCLTWILLHVRQGDWCDLQLETKSPTDEADIHILQLSFHWHFECPYDCLLCQHPIQDSTHMHKGNACRYENRYRYK